MMLCKIFRSDRKPETYLYLRDDMTFSDLPNELQQHFGPPAFVMQLLLDGKRRLARVDIKRVKVAIEEEGYFLQLPPELPVEDEISRRFS